MTLLLAASLLTSFSFMTPLLTTPITLGVWIFCTALFTSLFISTMTSSWFGLILFIIYIGGMLVMFSYFAATAPNQKLSLSSILALLLTSLFLMYLLFLLAPQSWLNCPTSNTSFSTFTYLFSAPQGILLIALALLLLLALIYVVKITNRNLGPLRPYN